jgi:hypothetical protein
MPDIAIISQLRHRSLADKSRKQAIHCDKVDPGLHLRRSGDEARKLVKVMRILGARLAGAGDVVEDIYSCITDEVHDRKTKDGSRSSTLECVGTELMHLGEGDVQYKQVKQMRAAAAWRIGR